MPLQDVIKNDQRIFFNANDFATPAVYTPQGGAARNINIKITDEVDEVFETGTADLDFDALTILIAADDTTGVAVVSEMGRPGAGDTLVIPTNASPTWYVRKIMTRAADSKMGKHRLLITNSQAVLEDLV